MDTGTIACLVLRQKTIVALMWVAVLVVDLPDGTTVLATGILFDATMVRALLVPALASTMGHWN